MNAANVFAEIHNRFTENLSKIDSLINIGSEMEKIMLDSLKNFEIEFKSATPAFIPLKKRLSNLIGLVETIKGNPALKKNYEIVYNQALVLIVANFESFMNDLFKGLVNNHLYLLNWDDKQKITIDTNLLKYSTAPDIGSIFLKSLDDLNFQDLKSTLRFLGKYLKCDTNFLSKEEKEKIILFQSFRHIIIHNSSTADERFLKQIEDTQFKDDYKKGDLISLNEDQYKEARKIFEEFSIKVLSSTMLKELDTW